MNICARCCLRTLVSFSVNCYWHYEAEDGVYFLQLLVIIIHLTISYSLSKRHIKFFFLCFKSLWLLKWRVWLWDIDENTSDCRNKSQLRPIVYFFFNHPFNIFTKTHRQKYLNMFSLDCSSVLFDPLVCWNRLHI